MLICGFAFNYRLKFICAATSICNAQAALGELAAVAEHQN
jgi:hypothetical protein